MLRRRYSNWENWHSSFVLEFDKAQQYSSDHDVCYCHFHSGFAMAGKEKGFEF